LIDDPLINEILLSSADQLSVAVPMPAVPEMRYNWDAMRPWFAKMMQVRDGLTPEEAALGMQMDMETIRESRR
jgi:maltose-binding protein MalE